MSSSSSSSLLYINVLLLVLIHSSIQQGLPNNATSKATKRLLKAQDLKNRYLGFIVNTRNNINQKRAKMLKAHPKEQEILDNYMSCIISRKAKDLQRRLVKDVGYLEKEFTRDYPGHSEKLLENLKLCEVIQKQHFDELQSKEKHMTCIKPKNIKAYELANLEKSYEEQVSNYKYMNQFKLEEYYLSQLTENLKEPVSKHSVV